MKANKAPHKVYLHLTTGNRILNGKYYEHKPAKIRYDDKIIEYTRTDTFIKKACKFIDERFNFDDDTCHIEGEVIIKDKVIDDFKNYLKGE